MDMVDSQILDCGPPQRLIDSPRFGSSVVRFGQNFIIFDCIRGQTAEPPRLCPMHSDPNGASGIVEERRGKMRSLEIWGIGIFCAG
jgi:hypothetical protein